MIDLTQFKKSKQNLLFYFDRDIEKIKVQSKKFKDINKNTYILKNVSLIEKQKKIKEIELKAIKSNLHNLTYKDFLNRFFNLFVIAFNKSLNVQKNNFTKLLTYNQILIFANFNISNLDEYQNLTYKQKLNFWNEIQKTKFYQNFKNLK